MDKENTSFNNEEYIQDINQENEWLKIQAEANPDSAEKANELIAENNQLIEKVGNEEAPIESLAKNAGQEITEKTGLDTTSTDQKESYSVNGQVFTKREDAIQAAKDYNENRTR